MSGRDHINSGTVIGKLEGERGVYEGVLEIEQLRVKRINRITRTPANSLGD